jgi:acetyl-CoA acetyltransferase
MLQTAENVAAEAGIGQEEQSEITLTRHEQYEKALADDRAFQKRYMLAVDIGRGKKAKSIAADEGVFPTSREGLAKLKPVIEGGSVTFGAQTFPADGNAGMIVANRQQAETLSRDKNICVQILSFASARVKKSFMPMAVVPAAEKALENAGIALKDLKSVKTHNPFAVNDIYFCRETGWDPRNMNNYGSPLIFGHPQGPTGLRVIIELIEELVINGGGYGLFTGCAAGDTAMAVVLKVS